MYLLALIACVVTFTVSADKIMSSVNKDTFSSSFPIGRLFITVSCLLSLATTFDTMLHRSGQSRLPCLVPDLKGKAFTFHLGVRLASGLIHFIRDQS